MSNCDKCGTDQHNTLYDWENQMICLGCIPEDYKDSWHRHNLTKVGRLMKAAVTGDVNIERRRRSIEKRKLIQ